MLAALIVKFSRFASRVMQCTERKLMDNICELFHCLYDYLVSTHHILYIKIVEMVMYNLYYAEFLHQYQPYCYSCEHTHMISFRDLLRCSHA